MRTFALTMTETSLYSQLKDLGNWRSETSKKPSHSKIIFLYLIMTGKAILRQLQSFPSQSQRRSLSALSRSHFTPVQVSPVSKIISASRYYSIATETSTGSANPEPPPTSNAAPGSSNEAEDPAKKELEAKSREITDLKVSKAWLLVASFKSYSQLRPNISRRLFDWIYWWQLP